MCIIDLLLLQLSPTPPIPNKLLINSQLGSISTQIFSPEWRLIWTFNAFPDGHDIWYETLFYPNWSICKKIGQGTPPFKLLEKNGKKTSRTPKGVFAFLITPFCFCTPQKVYRLTFMTPQTFLNPPKLLSKKKMLTPEIDY